MAPMVTRRGFSTYADGVAVVSYDVDGQGQKAGLATLTRPS